MPYVNVNNVQYYYELQGAGQPLVLLHGFTGSVENWTPHAAVFGQQYLTISIDLLGHGRTDAPTNVDRYSMEACANDIVEILQKYVSEPVNLLGYSMGGRLALYLAVKHPSWFRTVILESSSPGLESQTERQKRVASDEQLAADIERDGIEAFVRRWEQIPLFSSQEKLPGEVQTSLRQQRMENNPVGLANSLRGMGTGAQPSLWSDLSTLDLPLLLLAGELDQKFVGLGREMSAVAPRATFKIVTDAGHTVHLEQPAQFDTLVLHFLEQIRV